MPAGQQTTVSTRPATACPASWYAMAFCLALERTVTNEVSSAATGSARQAPLQSERIPGTAGADDTEVAARLRERDLIDVVPPRLRLDGAHRLGATGERVLGNSLSAFRALGPFGDAR